MDDDFVFDQRPGTRSPGKLKRGKFGSGRRMGEHRCMGRCCMCSYQGGKDSYAHLTKKKCRDGSWVDSFSDPCTGKMVSLIMDRNGKTHTRSLAASGALW